MNKQNNYQLITKRWKRWRFKNTSLLLVSLVLFFYLAGTPFVDNLIKQIGSVGYLGAFITGIFFVSTFTVAPAAVVLYHIADVLHPIEVALLAGLGAMLGDYIIFKYMTDKVFYEILPLVKKLHTPKLKLLFKSPYFAWLLPLVGAFVIASPLPDEVGVSMLGLAKIKKWKFFLLAFALNSFGIFIVVTTARS